MQLQGPLWVFLLFIFVQVLAHDPNSQLAYKITKLEKTVSALSESVGKLKNDVAIEVALRRDVSYADDQVFKFDHVKYNTGSAYNSGSGIFVVPVSGTYLLWAHIMRNDRHWMSVGIHSSEKKLLTGYTNGGSIIHGVASVTGVAYLKKGEHVWWSKRAYRMTSLRGADHSSYGGALLKAH